MHFIVPMILFSAAVAIGATIGHGMERIGERRDALPFSFDVVRFLGIQARGNPPSTMVIGGFFIGLAIAWSGFGIAFFSGPISIGVFAPDGIIVKKLPSAYQRYHMGEVHVDTTGLESSTASYFVKMFGLNMLVMGAAIVFLIYFSIPKSLAEM